VGDSIAVGIRHLLVTGLTSGSNLLATQLLFLTVEDAAASIGTRDKASFVVVQVTPRADVARVARDIEARFPKLTAFTRETFLTANQREVSSGFIPLLALIGALGVAAAGVLVGLLVHAVAEERRADLAVLFALGADGRAVGLGMLAHALILVTLGAVAGTTTAYLLQAILYRVLPTIPMDVALHEALAISGVFMASGMIAAAVPVARLNQVDPMEAFRA
jgi:ABC-type antimicrobial peptide transport system permease subunit